MTAKINDPLMDELKKYGIKWWRRPFRKFFMMDPVFRNL